MKALIFMVVSFVVLQLLAVWIVVKDKELKYHVNKIAPKSIYPNTMFEWFCLLPKRKFNIFKVYD